ncbi:hypothetical protein Tco_0412586 [Tanacetum coccineum]
MTRSRISEQRLEGGSAEELRTQPDRLKQFIFNVKKLSQTSSFTGRAIRIVSGRFQSCLMPGLSIFCWKFGLGVTLSGRPPEFAAGATVSSFIGAGVARDDVVVALVTRLVLDSGMCREFQLGIIHQQALAHVTAQAAQLQPIPTTHHHVPPPTPDNVTMMETRSYLKSIKSLQFEHSAFPGLSAAPKSPEEELTRKEEIEGVDGLGKELVFPKVISSFHLKYPHP